MIRPWSRGDEVAVDGLATGDVDALWVAQGHGLHGRAWQRGGRWRKTLIGVEGRRLVRAASLATNRVHGGRLSCAVEVAAPDRRRGVGRALLAEVLSLAPSGMPVAAKVRPGSAGHGFATAAGGSIYQRSPGPRVDLSDPAVREWCAARSRGADDDATVESLARLPAPQLADAFVQQYRWVHAAWSPVSDLSALGELAATTVKEPDVDVSSAAWLGDRLVAVAFAFPNGVAGMDVVAETQRQHEPSGASALAASIGRCLTQPRIAGLGTVEFDGHVTDPHLFPILGSIPGVSANPVLHVELIP